MSKSVAPKKINRFAISLVEAAGVAVGSAPALALMQRPRGWLLLILLCWVVSALTMLGFRKVTYHRPNAFEYLLAGFNATFTPAFLGLAWMAIYFILYWLVSGTEWLAYQAWQVEWDQANLAYLISMVVAAILYMILASSETTSLAETLYPATAGMRSPYYNLVNRNPKAVRSGLITRSLILAVLLAGIFIWPKGWLTLAAVQFYFFMAALDYLPDNIKSSIKTSSPIEQASGGSRKQKQEPNAAQVALSNLPFAKAAEPPAADFTALAGSLFEAAGWTIEQKPRTQDPAIDPLLENVQLLAQSGERSVVVEIVLPSKADPEDEMKNPSDLKQAAWVLAEARGLDPDQLTASLVFLDGAPPDRVGKISRKLGVSLLSLESAQIRRTLEQDEGDSRRKAAEALLGLEKPAAAQAAEA